MTTTRASAPPTSTASGPPGRSPATAVLAARLSGGYTRDEANNRLRRNHGMVASFSRALVEGLTAQQSDTEFNARLDAYVQSIFEASNT